MDLIEDKLCHLEYQGERRNFIIASSLVIMTLSMITRAFIISIIASANALLILLFRQRKEKASLTAQKCTNASLESGFSFKEGRFPIICKFSLFENNSVSFRILQDTTNDSTTLSCRCDQLRAQKEDILVEHMNSLGGDLYSIESLKPYGWPPFASVVNLK
ncbi:hypothetical protein ACFE04_027904 [Oxalis oulophora]